MASRIAAALLLVLACAFGAAYPARAATVSVTGTGDTITVDGSVTLREAIASVNGAANVNADVSALGTYGSGDTIAFAIPGGGPHTIAVGALPLPVIARPVIVDGYTQPGSTENTLAVGDNAVLNVILQGTTSGVHGLEVGPGGSNSVITGLVLQRHFFALQITGSNVHIHGNFIGTDRGGTTADSTTTNGLGVNVGIGNIGNNVIGGSTPAERNVISGNGTGIVLNSQLSNTVRGNYIGVTSTGTAALPNANSGIYIGSVGAATIGGAVIGGATATPGQGAGNVISGNQFRGIQILTGSLPTVIGPSTIQGNILGLDANGVNAIPNAGANIYLYDSQLPNTNVARLGPVTIDDNVLSAGGHGVFSLAAGTVIRGNRIGTDITGTLARPNTFGLEITGTNLAFVGSATIGGTGAGEGNIISGNSSHGVRLLTSTATFEGNRIGTSATGGALGNGGYGIIVDSSLASIGGTAAGAGNTIANNGDTGVQVQIAFSDVRAASEASILGNSITNNGLLGINNSAPDVVTANDASDGDAGPNNLQNYPVITAASLSGGNVTVSGTLNSTASTTFRVELFSNAGCDSTGFGEAATFLGGFDVTTDGSGNAGFGPTAFAVPAGQPVITATATDPAGHTSELSSCVTATGGPAPLPTLSIDSVSATEGNAGTTPLTFTVTLSAASATPVTVSFASANGSATTADSDYMAVGGTLTFAPGGPLTQTITVDVVGDLAVEANETLTVTLFSPSGATLATATGTGTVVNDDGTAPPEPTEIPTLSEWGALLLVGLLALAGLARLGR